ncbi:alpha/beta fold hydrolase [Altererythrobacter arenosus]|uniref:Alpha/beta fold hydrolase n=1 Tax=Altererythrobacter arenosus TaxID=3032592 RepID=A0ABY8FMU9_9SPHN|nr:alpha/beta fold hydrolase [Altererythrobacter sp. CAU 1644]WFL76346.1 alpha/beta fold hydrolase [Altererythrobacter sp. CAU 1644]
MSIRRGYSDTPAVQVHWRMAGEAGGAPDLVCLHPAPFSGLAFTTIMPLLARNRQVIAPDFPGHGGSDPGRADATIADYAQAMASVVEDLAGSVPVDLFGFHTGCLVACELALTRPQAVRRLVLVDVPAFDPETRADQLAESAVPPGFTPELESLAPAWERGITRRIESQGMDRSFAMFVEQLRHGEAMNAGFHAGFSYEVEDRLARIAHPATVIATQSGLLDATRRAARLIPQARLVERLDITRAVLDEAAAETASEVLRALDA